MKYETVMGLEVHVELSTESKLFCSCSAKFGAQANENVCPACCGMPGMPAVLNKKAVELGIAAALLTNSEITPIMSFDKKSYYYPDLPTGYQITQWFSPICTNGWIEIDTENGEKKIITLKQIHIEEDAGKLVHDPYTGATLVDYNRASVPLVEIVSNPDFRTADEVVAYLEKLRSLLSFAGVSDCKMQEGSMRCDVNISVREEGSNILGTRIEIKNMNSLKAITRAIEYESWRQINALETGDEILVQQTRRWDDDRGETYSMRTKETAADYRYFPNPELMPVHLDEKLIDSVRAALPETAQAMFMRMTLELGLPEYDSKIITSSRNLSRIFNETFKYINNAKEISNWIIGDLLGVANAAGITEEDINIDCEKFASLIKLVEEKTINRATGKKVLVAVIEEGIDPAAYVSEHGLGMVADTGLLDNAIKEVVAENEKSVADYHSGKDKALGFLVGQVMRKTQGKADPQAVNEMLLKELNAEK
ncbi:MAG: Asp-tRNA(Asn)/Glu-tRNA(Gln) amidotransferase subunit GatB [Oscillospiraceae bacterium]|nr:Asp-tRNA(Asn)/Glu-tRNA(Gln) amidotransferase subunit GatB [Oscillospiraceae bacterium]